MGMHLGRHWPHTYKARARGTELHETIEEQCPCPVEPCGCVDSDKASPDCEHHSGLSEKTMRWMHDADDCPGAPSEA